MSEAVGLERMETLEIKDRLHQPQACRIAIGDRHDIRPKSLADRLVARDELPIDLADHRARHVDMVEP